MVEHFFGNWKTTVQGLLSAVISLSLVAPTLSLLNAKQVASIVAAGAVAKVVLGMFQKDAGTVVATTPSNPEPHIEASHEVAFNPKAVPVPSKES